MRVLLVDANFLCPTVHSIYNIPLKPGFAEYLEGNADARIIHAVGNNLSVMASGDKSLLPRTLLSGQAGFRTRLRDLCKDYDIVLVDAAPITVCPETFSLATGTDGVIFVVKSEKTRKAVVQASLEQLRLARARILGGILNFRQFHIPSWLYN